MKIIVNSSINPNIWNKFVQNKIFFRFEWFYVIQNSYKLDPYFVLCYEENEFALIASFKTVKGYISLPFVSYSGFYFNSDEALKELEDYLKKNGIDIDSRDLIEDEIKEGCYVNPIVHIDTYEKFWNNISSNMRNQFKKSEKKGYTFKKSNDIEEFYKIYSLGMRNLGTPVHSKKYFYELKKYFPFHIFTIYDNAKPIGSMFCLSDNDTLAVLYAYTLPYYSKQYANYFLYLNAIRWMVKNNLKYFDMGRSTYNEGTFHFKKKFKPKLYVINSKINYTSNSILQVASKIWKKLPLPVANFLGPKIRKYLP